ncbi:DUF4225 domain-containing protein [Morganella morganii]|uniref:DUF4225 domain-containing protein n=1 Tax=Morganella morganii TaxID=582 RepID=UPI0004691B09|nr:DUF4225 domain-containing protein [Morganella morganii]
MPTARVLSTQPAYNREFDDYCNKLKTLSERAASYLLYDPEVKIIYRENIRKAIAYLREEFYRKRSSAEDYYTYREGRDNAFNGLIYLYQSEEADYQRGRRNDVSVYESTKQFEEQGWIFYAKEGFQIVGGCVQIAGGFLTFRTGRLIRSNTLKGIGALAMATGLSNTIEHSAFIQYEITNGESGGGNKNYMQNAMAEISEYVGYGRKSGELTYKAVDFGVSFFLSFGALVKLKNPNRLLHMSVPTRNGIVYPTLMERLFGDKGGFFLWHALRSDFTFKVNQMSKPFFIYNAGMSVNKLRLILSEYTDD